MTENVAMLWSQVSGAEGLDIIHRFLDEDKNAQSTLSDIIDRANAGEYDAQLAGNPGEGVHVTTSCHLMVL